MAEELLDIGHGEAEINGQEHTSHIPSAGVEAIQGGAPATGEALFAGLAFELLDTVAHTLANQGVEGSISVAPIITERVRTNMASRADVLMFAAPAFTGGPGFNTGFVSMPPKRLGMGPATDGAIQRGAGFQGTRLFGQNDGFVAKGTSPRQQLQYNEERDDSQRRIDAPRPRYCPPPAIQTASDDEQILSMVKRFGSVVCGSPGRSPPPQAPQIIPQGLWEYRWRV
jgi:hypothetical protein